MSINNAMLAGVAGLQANSSALAAISDNIANVNTVGYKRNDVSFESLVTASTGEGTYSAGGVTTSNQQYVSQQGSTTQTSSPTDMAIAGQGMFVTNSQPTAVGATSQIEFTRAGSFAPDSSGFLKNSAGLYLMGWAADAQGNITTSSSNLSALSPININSLSGAVAATSNATASANLDAGGTVSAQAATYAATVPATSMTGYNPTTGTGVKPDFSIQLPVSDSQGGQHTLQVDFLKSGTAANTWSVEIQALNTSDVPAVGGGPAGQIAYGTATFNTDGSLATLSLTTPAGVAIPIAPPAAATSLTQQLSVAWAPSLGVTTPQTITLDLGAKNGVDGLTQYSSPSVVQSTSTNGTSFGNLASISVDKNGFVTATFDNGTSRKIAQVALATFPNPDGLQSIDGNAYLASNASGAFSLKAAGTGGAGAIASSTLESSTVDLSAEFTNLIITQRAYTASSKTITVADQMTQDLLNIIR